MILYLIYVIYVSPVNTLERVCRSVARRALSEYMSWSPVTRGERRVSYPFTNLYYE